MPTPPTAPLSRRCITRGCSKHMRGHHEGNVGRGREEGREARVAPTEHLHLLEGEGDGEGIVQTTCSPDQASVLLPRPRGFWLAIYLSSRCARKTMRGFCG